jgi:hypothetical protein
MQSSATERGALLTVVDTGLSLRSPGETPAISPERELRVRRMTTLGMIASLALHSLLTVTMVVVGLGGGGDRAGGKGSGSREALSDFAISPEVQLTSVAPAMLDVQMPTTPAVGVPELGTEGPLSGPGGFDEPASGTGLGSIGDGLGGSGGGSIGDGAGLGGGGTGGGASFFGIEAKGNRFLYICDVSGSMSTNDGPNATTRLGALKVELAESINALLDSMSFSIVWFSSSAEPLFAERSWTLANAGGKQSAVTAIAARPAFGGTQPWPAFEIALSLSPGPDAIYFLTDGVFDPEVALRLSIRNVGGRRVPIHCITLIERSGEEVMRKIASESGGTYRHVGSQ